MPTDWLKIKSVDMHTGGEPLRILTEGVPEIKGNTILEKRRYFLEHLDYIRTGTILEPRGHADMYGAVITAPETPDGDFGVIFLHNEGYSTMCGHAILALTKYAFERGLADPDEKNELLIDVPAGRIKATATLEEGRVTRSAFMNVPSFVLLSNEVVRVPRLGIVHVDVAFGGAYYAICDGDKLRLRLEPSNVRKIITHGLAVRKAVSKHFKIDHPYEDDLGFLYGTIFTGKSKNPAIHSRNVCIFADGEVDRSATGSGVSARAALHHARGELSPGETITIESLIGTTMDVRIAQTLQFAHHDAVIPEVSGTSYFTGSHEFWFDPNDPLRKGFLLK
jgi:proline racemase